MRFSHLYLSTLLPLALGLPVVDSTTEAATTTSVNFANGRISGTPDEVKDSYIIVYKKTASDAAIASYEAGIGGKLGRSKGPAAKFNKVKNFRASWVETNKQGIEKIAKDPLVDFVEINSVVRIPESNEWAAPTTEVPVQRQDVPGSHDVPRNASAKRDFQQNVPWGLAKISNRDPQGLWYWYDGSSCAGTVIYVLDTGIRTTHAEFRDGWRAQLGPHFITDNPYDTHGHGTHCAGTAAGKTIGVCRNAIVVSVKVLDGNGSGNMGVLMQGIEWAANDAAQRGVWNRAVLSISIGGGYFQAVNDLIDQLGRQGLTIVVAAGNDNKDVASISPASAQEAITVAASDQRNNRAYFSNYGNLVDIFGPGVDVYSASHLTDDAYTTKSGTSMATPHAAGVAAYLMTLHNLNTAAQVRGRMYDFANWNWVSDAKSPNALLHNGWA